MRDFGVYFLYKYISAAMFRPRASSSGVVTTTLLHTFIQVLLVSVLFIQVD